MIVICVFQAVTIVKFAHNDRARLLCASKDGTVSICDVTSSPARVLLVLRAHTRPVTACDWSADNDHVVSGSADSTLRLWDSRTGQCLRVVKDPGQSGVSACLFQPVNNNMIIVSFFTGQSYPARRPLHWKLCFAYVRVNSCKCTATLSIGAHLRTIV